MKTCTKCKRLLSRSDFYVRSTGYIFSCCKTCSKNKTREWQKSNPEKFAKISKLHSGLVRQRNRDFLFEFLNSHPCVDCGETDYLVLELDHINGDKKMGVATMTQRTYSLESIKSEIDKCEVRCCNCHRRKTIKQFGEKWWSRVDR